MTPGTKMTILSVLCPPAAVMLRRGAGTEFFVCVILTLCAFVPGVVYALWTIRSPD